MNLLYLEADFQVALALPCLAVGLKVDRLADGPFESFCGMAPGMGID